MPPVDGSLPEGILWRLQDLFLSKICINFNNDTDTRCTVSISNHNSSISSIIICHNQVALYCFKRWYCWLLRDFARFHSCFEVLCIWTATHPQNANDEGLNIQHYTIFICRLHVINQWWCMSWIRLVVKTPWLSCLTCYMPAVYSIRLNYHSKLPWIR